MNLTIGHIIAYSLDAQFRFNGEYPGPHRDIGKNIELINRILTENGYNQPLNSERARSARRLNHARKRI